MKVQEILEIARLRLDDTVTPYRWSDRELLLYLEQAQSIFAEQTHVLRDDSTSSVCDIQVVSGTAEYPISPLILDIKEAVLDSKPIEVCVFEELQTYYPWWRLAEPSSPFLCVTYIEMHKVRLYPPPNTNGVLHFLVARLPMLTLTLNTPGQGETDVPEIPERYHNDLINGVLMLAYLKRDSETVNIAESSRYEAKFISAINNAKVQHGLMTTFGKAFVPHRGCL